MTGSYSDWLAAFHTSRAAETSPFDMAGHLAPPALPDACDHCSLFYRHSQLATPVGNWLYGVFSRSAYAYEEASHRGYLVEVIPARWPDECSI